MSDELLQFIIVVAFGALCFGCGYLIAFIVTRKKYRNEMIKRGLARYNQQTGKWEWGSRQRNRRRGKCNDPKRGDRGEYRQVAGASEKGVMLSHPRV